MSFDFSVEDAVTKRYSVRIFDKRPVEKEIREKLLSYANHLHNPLGPGIRVQFIEKAAAKNGEKLETYGVIKGAQLYLAVTVSNEEYALERNLSEHFARKHPDCTAPQDMDYITSWVLE